ncbi:protein Arv1p [Trichomonascus vanleenenianus]|uniref:sterol homeostasis protein ARV1 n=1 Tax=Trichomonascus vanleenenianus TaxID=2268995 RepID=UPI003ECB22E7
MICIECTHEVSTLYTRYSPSNIRLTACPNCNKFADRYIEHDGVNVVIDLLLLKPQAYRHVVFNVLSPSNDPMDRLHSMTKKMWLLVTLFDVYLTWARAEKSSRANPLTGYILSLPVLAQYIVFLVYCVLDTLAVHVSLRLLAWYWVHWTRPNTLSTAVLIASSSKLFPILMLIWSYDIPIATKVVGWAVSFNIVEVLTTILDCGYPRAVVMTGAAELLKMFVCDYAFSRLIHWYAGLPWGH